MSQLSKYRKLILMMVALVYIRYMFIALFYNFFINVSCDGREITNSVITEALEVEVEQVKRITTTLDSEEIYLCNKISDIPKEKIMNILQRCMNSYETVTGVYIGTEENTLFGIYNNESIVEENFKDGDWYNETRISGDIVYGFNKNLTNGVPSVIISSPLFNKDIKFLGVIAIELDQTMFSSLLERYEKENSNTIIEVYDADGELIYSSPSINKVILNKTEKIYPLKNAEWFVKIIVDNNEYFRPVKIVQNSIGCIIFAICFYTLYCVFKKKNNVKSCVLIMIAVFLIEVAVTLAASVNLNYNYGKQYARMYLNFETLRTTRVDKYKEMKINFITHEIENTHNKKMDLKWQLETNAQDKRFDNENIVSLLYIADGVEEIFPNNNDITNKRIITELKEKLADDTTTDEIYRIIINQDLNDECDRYEELLYRKAYDENGKPFGVVGIHFVFEDLFVGMRKLIKNYDSMKFPSQFEHMDENFNIFYHKDGKEIVVATIDSEKIKERIRKDDKGEFTLRVDGVNHFIVYYKGIAGNHYELFDYSYMGAQKQKHRAITMMVLAIMSPVIVAIAILIEKKKDVAINEEQEILKDIEVLKKNDKDMNKDMGNEEIKEECENEINKNENGDNNKQDN